MQIILWSAIIIRSPEEIQIQKTNKRLTAIKMMERPKYKETLLLE